MDKIFGRPFQPKKIIDNPSDESLRAWALEHGGIITEFGNLSVVTKVRHRMAKLTEVIMGDPEPDDMELINNVLDYLKDKETRSICQNQVQILNLPEATPLKTSATCLSANLITVYFRIGLNGLRTV